MTLFAIGAFLGGFLTFIFALALPGALIYGAVVRLREAPVLSPDQQFRGESGKHGRRFLW